MKIGLAVLKSSGESETDSSNLLIKRFTLQIENLKQLIDSDSDESANEPDIEEIDEQEPNKESLRTSQDEWQFRDSLLKCLYSQEPNYPFGIKMQFYFAQYLSLAAYYTFKDFKWQIQIRTSNQSMQNACHNEDLFKV